MRDVCTYNIVLAMLNSSPSPPKSIEEIPIELLNKIDSVIDLIKKAKPYGELDSEQVIAKIISDWQDSKA